MRDVLVAGKPKINPQLLLIQCASAADVTPLFIIIRADDFACIATCILVVC